MGISEQPSLYLFISVFGGSTLLLFLICFCCQRKLQARTLAMAEIANNDDNLRQRQRMTRRSDTHHLLPDVLLPPPDYSAVIKKDSMCQSGLPTYDVAIAGLKSDGYV